MGTAVLRAEALGKRYTLAHGETEEYLRDAIPRLARTALGRFLGHRSTVRYEEFWAIRDISFEADAGDRIGIIGRNGAGKSTLLKVLSRVTTPTEGRALVRGRLASLLEVGTGFHPELTGRENVFLSGAVLGMTAAEVRRRFDEMVAFAEVERFLDTPVKHYSSGMYLRLAFAVAAFLEPDILIVDEVLAVGDFAFQKKCLSRMESAHREGRTVLFVSHNLEAVARLCNRGILLAQGRVSFSGSAGEAIDRYVKDVQGSRSAGVADFSDVQRTADHVASLRRFYMARDATAGPTSSIVSGASCAFVISFSTVDVPSGSGIALHLQRWDGFMACAWYSYGTAEIPRGVPEVRMVLGVESLPLVPGEYTVVLSLCDRAYQILDQVAPAWTFEVTARDGMIPSEANPRAQAILLPGSWSVNRRDNA
jgi:lipopolysaccharide transport system ATP-binding protein